MASNDSVSSVSGDENDANAEIWCNFAMSISEGDESACFSLINEYGPRLLQCYGCDQNLFSIAAEYGSPELVQCLIDLGADVNEVYGYDDMPPLLYAIKNIITETYKVLLSNGADIKIPNCHPPLEEALYIGSIERIEVLIKKPSSKNFKEQTEIERSSQVVEFILEHKTDLQLESREFAMLVFFAARLGVEETFELVLQECKKYLLETRDANKKPINIQGYFGRTALHYAVRSELPEVVKFLLNHGIDVNIASQELYTPLHYATSLENKKLMQMLLETGADINCSSSDHSTPLSLVSGKSELKALLNLNYYIQYGEQFTRRMEHQLYEETIWNEELIEFLLKNGAKMEQNVFNEACQHGNLSIIKLLIKYGADSKFKDTWGRNCLYYAALSCKPDALEFLLTLFGDLDNWQESLATHLNYISSLEMIELLVSYGIDVDFQDKNLDTILHKVYYKNYEKIECLLRLNGDITIKNLQNDSPLIKTLRDCYGREESSEIFVIQYVAMKLDKYINYIEEIKDLDLWKWACPFFEECQLQVDKMKKTRICKEIGLSFYEFLTLDIYFVTKLGNNENVMGVLKNYNYSEFPAYEKYFELQLSRVQSLKQPVEKAQKFLEKYWEEKLPSSIIYIILSYLQPIEFKNFERALSIVN